MKSSNQGTNRKEQSTEITVAPNRKEQSIDQPERRKEQSTE